MFLHLPRKVLGMSQRNVHQLSFTFFDYVGFICVSWPKIFVRVIDDVDFIFFRNQFVKCPFSFSTQIEGRIVCKMIFNDFVDSISELPTKFIHLIECVLSHIMIFEMKLFV